jgi:microcystin-dependent protein
MKKYRNRASFTIMIFVCLLNVERVNAGTDPFIGEIMWTASNFCPRGWTQADGQLLSIWQNTALFSLLGTTYGGDGRTTFGLPDMRGRVSVHTGNGAGLGNYRQGQKGGEERVTLTTAQMPSHNHSINASTDQSDKSPDGSVLGYSQKNIYDAPTNASVTLADSAVSNSGGSRSHENRSPYVTMRACIALVGVYPSRN